MADKMCHWPGTYFFSYLFIYLFSIFKLFHCCSITVVCIFSPSLYPTPAKPTSLSCFHPPPWFSPCVLYSSSWNPFSPLSLPPLPGTYFNENKVTFWCPLIMIGRIPKILPQDSHSKSWNCWHYEISCLSIMIYYITRWRDFSDVIGVTNQLTLI